MRTLTLLFLCAVGFVSTGSDIKDFYETPAVKKLGIKKPPKNRLKTDLSRPASEQELAAFLNTQASEHRDLSSRTVGLVRYIKPKFLAECINELNKVAGSVAWKRLANSNISYVFHADVKKYKDEIYFGLNSINSKLNELEFEANEKLNRRLVRSASKEYVPIEKSTSVQYDFRTSFHILNCTKCQDAGRVAVMSEEVLDHMKKIHKGIPSSLSKKQRNDNRKLQRFLNEHFPHHNTICDGNGNAFDIGPCPDFDL